MHPQLEIYLEQFCNHDASEHQVLGEFEDLHLQSNQA